MKKLLAVFSIGIAAFVALMAIPMVAAAEKVDLAGRGILMAQGTGRAEIKGRLNFEGGARSAVLVVEDRAGDAKIDVKGYGKRIDEGNGKVRYVGFYGRAHIEGSDVAIVLQGRDIKFVVRGEGVASLQGKGWYKVNGSRPKPWTQTGVTVTLPADMAAESEGN